MHRGIDGPRGRRSRSGVLALLGIACIVLPWSVGSVASGRATIGSQSTAPTAITSGDPALCVNPGFRAKSIAAFDVRGPALAEALRTQLSPSSSQVLYDTQLVLAPLIEMSVDCADRALLGRLAELLLPAESKLVRALDPNAGTEQRQWQVNGQEIRLNSSQFLYAVARVLTGIASVPPAERTPVMVQFAAVYAQALGEHLRFWLFDAPYFNPNGCSPNVASKGHGEFLRNKRARALGDGRSYCSSPADRDLLMTADAAELLRAATIDPTTVNLSALGIDRGALVSYLNDAADAYRSFFSPTTLTDETGAARAGLDFDTGGWRDWTEDHAYSAFTDARFPTSADAGTDPRASWDLSHARRLIGLFASMRAVGSALNGPFPTDDEMRAFAAQVAYGVATDAVRPRFRNYLSGVNGWFRVNYNGRPGFGYGPFDSGTLAFLEGGFGAWGIWSSRLATITKAVDAVLSATDPATIAFRNESYGVIWSNGARTRQLDATRMALGFYPRALLPPPPPPTATTTTAPQTLVPSSTGATRSAPTATRSQSATLAASLRWSPSYETKDPSAPVRGAKVPGTYAIFLLPEPPGATLVAWYLDGVGLHVDDANAPFDLRNGPVTSRCGRHVVTVVVTTPAQRITARVPFTVIAPCPGKVPSRR